MTDETENQNESEHENKSEETEVAKPSNTGKIEWMDLTVEDASRVKDFYCSVVGWSSSEVDMGMYSDYNVNLPDTDTTVAGICHARGGNANIPSQWMIYVRVDSVADSAEQCEKRGGKVIDGPRRMGGSVFCIIEDPAGAVLALISG